MILKIPLTFSHRFTTHSHTTLTQWLTEYHFWNGEKYEGWMDLTLPNGDGVKLTDLRFVWSAHSTFCRFLLTLLDELWLPLIEYALGSSTAIFISFESIHFLGVSTSKLFISVGRVPTSRLFISAGGVSNLLISVGNCSSGSPASPPELSLLKARLSLLVLLLVFLVGFLSIPTNTYLFICCLTSPLTIFHWYMRQHTGVQSAWRRLTTSCPRLKHLVGFYTVNVQAPTIFTALSDQTYSIVQ